MKILLALFAVLAALAAVAVLAVVQLVIKLAPLLVLLAVAVVVAKAVQARRRPPPPLMPALPPAFAVTVPVVTDTVTVIWPAVNSRSVTVVAMSLSSPTWIRLLFAALKVSVVPLSITCVP